MMDPSRQFEIRQEARFVLWALRCAVAQERGDVAAAGELQRGFELADVIETSTPFRQLAVALCSVDWPATVWHDPQCCCVSYEELFMLQALADACERQHIGDGSPSAWWRVLVPQTRVATVDVAARCWLRALHAAGVSFPHPRELIESLGQLEQLAAPARPVRLN